MNNVDEISQAERRRIMLEERRGRTYQGHAIGSADDERGGRYANAGNATTVVGVSPISYPRQPSTSPWANNPYPPEPLIQGDGSKLGYCIDRPDVTVEVEVTNKGGNQSHDSDGPTQTSDTTLEVRPITNQPQTIR